MRTIGSGGFRSMYHLLDRIFYNLFVLRLQINSTKTIFGYLGTYKKGIDIEYNMKIERYMIRFVSRYIQIDTILILGRFSIKTMFEIIQIKNHSPMCVFVFLSFTNCTKIGVDLKPLSSHLLSTYMKVNSYQNIPFGSSCFLHVYAHNPKTFSFPIFSSFSLKLFFTPDERH